MALISKQNMTEISKNRNSIHDITMATYTFFSKDGVKYFQIDTYGTRDRMNPEKISQSIQFDKDTAVFLIDILKNEFSIE
jgi:hypothetical protein